MSQARKPSGFLKQNYDKIILVTVLVGLLASGALLVFQLQAGAARISMTRAELEATAPKAVTAIDTAELDALSTSLANPYQTPPEQRKMLVGELRVSSIPDGLPIPFDALVCPFTGAKQPPIIGEGEKDTDGDGIPDIKEDALGLNKFDPSDAQVDADGDGFSNLEEVQAGTDLRDAAVAPPPSAKLRLTRVQVIPFKLRFLGISQLADGQLRYQLNLRTLEKTYFAKMNEEIEGYEVAAYEEKAPEGPTLVLKSGDKSIRLVQGRVVDEQARTAVMVFLVDGKGYKANAGETISLQGRDYKVVDIREDRVVIRDEEAGSEVDIGLLTDAERSALTTGRRAGVTP